MLVHPGLTGEPIAPSAAQHKLRQIDHALEVKAFCMLGVWKFAVIERWSERDARRERIQKGELEPDKDFDVVGWPDEASIQSAEDVADWMLRKLRPRAHEKAEYRKYLDSIEQHNRAQEIKNQQFVVDYAEELAGANAETLFANEQGNLGGKRTIKVYQTEPKQQPKRKGRDL